MSSQSMIPVFIAGTGRSGTTILRQILACHPQIVSVPRELRIIVDPDGALDVVMALSKLWSPYRADKVLNRFRHLLELSDSGSILMKSVSEVLRIVGVSPRPYTSLAMGKWFGRRFYQARVSQLISEIVRHKSRGSWLGSVPWQVPAIIYEAGPFEVHEIAEIIANFFYDLFRQLVSSEAQTHWLEDTPENLLRYHELLRLFPNMRFIHIYRDPRDVVASYRHFRWGGDTVETIAQRVAGMLNRWVNIRSSLAPGDYFEISLEELAVHPEPNLKGICEYIGLPMAPELLRIPLNKTNAGRWKGEFSPEEVKSVESCLSSLVQVFGYDI